MSVLVLIGLLAAIVFLLLLPFLITAALWWGPYLLAGGLWLGLIWNHDRLPRWAVGTLVALPFVAMFWPLTQLLR